MRKAAYCSQKVSENGTNYYLIDHIVSLNKNSETFVLWQANKLIEKGQGHKPKSREVKQHTSKYRASIIRASHVKFQYFINPKIVRQITLR